MAKTAKNTQETHPEYDQIDQAILQAITVAPDSSINQIANNLTRTGVINSRDTIYKRLRKRDYLSSEVEQIRQNHREQIARELMPLALGVTKKALKDKTLDAKDKYPYVSMVVKTDLGDQGADSKPNTINIEHLQALQIVMSGPQSAPPIPVRAQDTGSSDNE